jgi:hypothetical protein
MKSFFVRLRSIHARQILMVTAFVLGCLLVVDAAPQKTKSASTTAPGQKNSRKEKVSPAPAHVSVDLNNASEKDLDSLPGVGPVTAKKIIDHRPYQSVDDLAKAGVAAKEIERIRPMVTVGKAPAKSLGRSVPNESPAKIPASPSAPAGSARSTTGQDIAPPARSGMVWVNTETKVYHRESDRWYGKTKHGSYMTESEAIHAGARAAKR